MAKFYNNRVKTGKLAGSVFAIRNGETIERAYQPVVFNPSTDAQVASRAKLKLMSQLSAVVGPYVAIPREGSVSSRNMFVKNNYPLATFSNGNASVELTGLKLTQSALGMSPISVTREASSVTIALSNSNNDLDKVAYLILQKNADGTLRVFYSKVVDRSEDATFPLTRTVAASASLVVYAYGIRVTSEKARAVFGNYTALTTETVAKLVATRRLVSSDVTLTETVAAESNPS